MNAHIEAWNHVKEHIFGSVCEVARRVPWGFKEDMPSINNVTIEEFLKSNNQYDTIILHILVGEGLDKPTMCKVLDHAYRHCIKLIVLEHNPYSKDFKDLQDIGFIYDWLEFNGERIIFENWGRNVLYASTTMAPLHLPQLSDKYYNENINKTFVEPQDKGIDKEHLIYTHTSESPIDFELPNGTIWWVAGGGLPFESMKEDNWNIIIDSVLRQCIYWAHLFVKDLWKVQRLYSFYDFNPPPYQEQGGNPKHWRRIKLNGVRPNSIQHIALQGLMCKGDTIYVSTVHKNYWKHLEADNNIIDAWTIRDKPRLVKKNE